jgi:hypothetical protein
VREVLLSFPGNTWVPLMAPCHYILAIDGTQTLWMCVCVWWRSNGMVPLMAPKCHPSFPYPSFPRKSFYFLPNLKIPKESLNIKSQQIYLASSGGATYSLVWACAYTINFNFVFNSVKAAVCPHY